MDLLLLLLFFFMPGLTLNGIVEYGMVSVNQESSGTLPAAAKNKRACHSLQIGNLVIVV